MNNSYHHMSNLQHNNVTQLQHTSTPAAQSAANTSFGYIQHSQPQLLHQLSQQLQHQSSPNHHQHQLLPTNAIHSITNGSVPTTASVSLYGLNKGGFYTTSSASAGASTTHPNTILITNNFQQQQQQQSPRTKQQQTSGVYKGSNIRIISTPNFFSINRANNGSNTEDGQFHHIYEAQSAPVAARHHHLPNLMSTTYTPQPYHTTSSTFQPYYVPRSIATAEGLSVNASAVASNNLNNTSIAVNTANILPQSHTIAPMSVATNTIMSSNTNDMDNNHTSKNSPATICVTSQNNRNGGNRNKKQTVVLDRINICINNHYSESVPVVDQQVSPVIPLIQHNSIIDRSSLGIGTGSSNLRRPLSFSARSCSNADISSSIDTINSSAIIEIDEPDSTTTPTPHTPPLTPDISTSPLKSRSSTAQSPSSTTNNTQSSPLSSECKAMVNKSLENSFTSVAQTIKEIEVVEVIDVKKVATTPPQEDCNDGTTEQSFIEKTIQELLTPPPPTAPIASVPVPSLPKFKLGCDVFVKGQEDGRLYLGTIINCSEENKYLVSFDDTSEQWCTADEMRKLGGDQETASDISPNPMCVACKKIQFADVVEICERCGRGYHRGCTTETLIGSGVWHCKRCAKPMKLVEPQELITRGKPSSICRQFPYDMNNLNWDEKHRVNEEQMYCYCGSSGKFDHNMLQCCKCSNWFHTDCLQEFKSELLRGDSFFVFCCTVCNNGIEFIRRLQIEWAEVMHLILYNLRKHQNQKYHHLIKDIWPFILECRHLLPICRKWRELPETALMERIKETLKENTERFVCGREVKREHSYYGLRSGGPPNNPLLEITETDLTDELLINKYKLNLLKDGPENVGGNLIEDSKSLKRKLSTTVDDVYEFRIDDDTSEDEIPIKRIIDSAKKLKQLPKVIDAKRAKLNIEHTTLDVADDNAFDASCQLTTTTTEIASTTTEKNTQKHKANGKVSDASNAILDSTNNDFKQANNEQNKNSRKRKAFRVLKSSYENSRLCDLSSDENSSSSRGTSLNNIIPPPANFLGKNNPFLITSPKKNGSAGTLGSNSGAGCGGIENSIFNVKTLDFSSNLKSAGIIFSNLSTSNLAKAVNQPKALRTTKRRLSAKDITIGPNQEVRKRRIKKSNTRIEIISTTAINSVLPSNYFPIHAKDYNAMINRKLNRSIPLTIISTRTSTTTSASSSALTTSTNVSSPSSSMDSLNVEGGGSALTSMAIKARRQTLDVPQQRLLQQQEQKTQRPAHGRLLRQRPQRNNSCIGIGSISRRSSTSSNQSLSTSTNMTSTSISNNNLTSSGTNASSNDSDNMKTTTTTIQNLKQTVNKYFGGAMNRIEDGETYAVRAKRRLPSGQLQYLIEWGEQTGATTAAAIPILPPPPVTKTI